MLTAFAASAQSSQMATLLQDGNILNYYSSTAFKEALEAAKDGDVISLSSGVFQAVDITKNVSIRGAGITVQGFNDNEIPTVLTGDFTINTPASDTHHLNLEGIYHNGKIECGRADGFTANKCQFGKFSPILDHNSPKYRWDDFKFLHCIFTEFSDSHYYLDGCSVNFINCVLNKKVFEAGKENVTQFTNCIIATEYSVKYAQMVNSIIIMDKKSATNATIEANSTLNNCLVFNCTKFEANNQGNTLLNDATGLFKDNTFCQLAEDKKGYKGADGTEVGIHGGNLPFTPITSRPRITKFNVGSKTTADGKLSVDIEITGEE